MKNFNQTSNEFQVEQLEQRLEMQAWECQYMPNNVNCNF
jgi:hypothetical protein